ncbi:MAG TPA: glutamine-hydrolyzing carbamoyl-phosphate synthase small subunit [Phycisphaerales bacterium]|nr:glutamine-hydrolyzing carbamoyl-phosphate synthase small subunit [Phycisphaerales bacterium]
MRAPAPSPSGSVLSGPGTGRLALEDGSVFTGTPFGATGRGVLQAAEVVFNTAMTGYQEALTDPSYAGQVLVFTAPLIGNTGVNERDQESRRVQVSGVVVRELARTYSNFRATAGLADYLAGQGVLGITGVDTRAITRRLRSRGVMRGVITDRAEVAAAELVARARGAPSMAGANLVTGVGCSANQAWRETLGEWAPAPAEPASARMGARPHADAPLRVLALDCGAKANILRHLAERGCEVVVVPHDTPAATMLRMYQNGEIDGLFISNGPGDPAAVEATIGALREVLGAPAGQTPPTFGICLGHQLLGLASGAHTFKLKYGHRGLNHPVLNRLTGRVEITSQNHGFAVDPESLAAVGAEPTHVHLNDGTLAGFRLKDRPVFAVQHHPEASPGPHDSAYLFDEFVALMRAHGRRAGAPTS